MNRDHDDISGLLIPHPDRVARKKDEDSIRTESMLGLAVIAVIALCTTGYMIYRYWKAGEMVLALAGARL